MDSKCYNKCDKRKDQKVRRMRNSEPYSNRHVRINCNNFTATVSAVQPPQPEAAAASTPMSKGKGGGKAHNKGTGRK